MYGSDCFRLHLRIKSIRIGIEIECSIHGKFMSKTILDLTGKIDSLRLNAIAKISRVARSRNVPFNFNYL